MGFIPSFDHSIKVCEICSERFWGTGERHICWKCEREAIEKAKPRELGPIPSVAINVEDQK